MLNPGEGGPRPQSSGWSNRILLAAIAGILFLTLSPYRFSTHPHTQLNTSPFLLGKEEKRYGAVAITLNVLLFLPFGFGLCAKLRQRKWPWSGSPALVALGGAAFSYGIEFAQLYVPGRDSGWKDIVWNTAGAGVGAIAFAGIGGFVFRRLSRGEEKLESWISPGRVWLLLLAYLGAWFAVTVPFLGSTNLRNWEANAYLLIGNGGWLDNPWKGQVLQLQFWDHAIPDRLAEEISSGQVNAWNPSPLADYDLSLPAPIADQQHFLPDLSWTSSLPPNKKSGDAAAAPDGHSWLASQNPVRGLSLAVEKTNQFTVRVVCRPSQVTGAKGAIASIVQPRGKENLNLWQDGANLVFWIRNGATTNPWHLRWFSSKVFSETQLRDIVISFDGANLSFFVDGKKDRRSPRLVPGIVLAELFHRAKTSEFEIYNHSYYVMVFFPVGCVLGIGARKLGMRKLVGPFLVGFVIAPVLLQILFLRTGGQFFSFNSFGDSLVSTFLAMGAAWWMNVDRTSQGN
jgi:VanZ family protein